MIEIYFIGLVANAAYMLHLERPRKAAHWIAFAALTICWPLLVAFAVYRAIRICVFKSEKSA